MRLRPGRGLRVYFNFSVAQGLYRPMTPMGMDAIRLLTSGVAHLLGNPESADPLDGPPQFVEAGQRVFLDLTGVLRSRVGRTVMPQGVRHDGDPVGDDHAEPVRPAGILGHPEVRAAGGAPGGPGRRCATRFRCTRRRR